MKSNVLLGLIFLTTCALAQQYEAIPPRPQQFPGATLVQPSRQNFRQRPISPRVIPENIQPVQQPQPNQFRRAQPLRRVKAQSVQPQIIEQQRTNLIEDGIGPFQNKILAPTPLPQLQTQPAKLITPRPVEEEVNEDEEIPSTAVTTPGPATTYALPLQPGQLPAGFQRPQFLQPSSFRAAAPQPVQPVQYQGAPLQGRQLVRQQARPVQPVQIPINQIQQAVPPQIPVVAEEDQYYRQVPARPLKKQEPVRQQAVRQQDVVRQQPARVQTDYLRPVQREPHVKAPQRERKPVAQTIRKYHEEHEDGSITWGYENDDGSFKEETIGVDCVTRGKYGYFDPDGVKREYTYQTGIPCDKAQEAEEAASNQGFIDYTNNKYVLPNGDEIDLEAMVKNRARKPVSQYRN